MPLRKPTKAPRWRKIDPSKADRRRAERDAKIEDLINDDEKLIAVVGRGARGLHAPQELLDWLGSDEGIYEWNWALIQATGDRYLALFDQARNSGFKQAKNNDLPIVLQLRSRAWKAREIFLERTSPALFQGPERQALERLSLAHEEQFHALMNEFQGPGHDIPPDVEELLDLPGSALREVVESDLLSEEEPNLPLRHPAALRSWHAALWALGNHRLKSLAHGPLPPDGRSGWIGFHIPDGQIPETARALSRADDSWHEHARFFTNLQDRLLECEHTSRMTDRERADSVVHEAMTELRELYYAEYARYRIEARA